MLTRVLPFLLIAGLAAGADPDGPPKPPAAKPAGPLAIVSLNPNKAEPVVPAPAPGGLQKVSTGKVQVLKLDNYDGPPVSWNVIQPAGAGGKKLEIIKWITLPKAAPVFGWMEGAAEPDKYTFGTETLVIMATGKGSGYVTVQALVIEDGAIKSLADILVEVSGGALPPEPVVPKPDPKPEPIVPKPEPVNPAVDQALVTKLKDAFAKDTAAPAPGGGTKANLIQLGVVYESSAGLLENEADPNLRPKTVGDIVERVKAGTDAKGVPTRPYLSAVRDVIDADIGTYNVGAAATAELKTEIAGKYQRVAAAIKEVTK